MLLASSVRMFTDESLAPMEFWKTELLMLTPSTIPNYRRNPYILEAAPSSPVGHRACEAKLCTFKIRLCPIPRTIKFKAHRHAGVSKSYVIKSPNPRVVVIHPNQMKNLYLFICEINLPVKTETGTRVNVTVRRDTPVNNGEYLLKTRKYTGT